MLTGTQFIRKGRQITEITFRPTEQDGQIILVQEFHTNRYRSINEAKRESRKIQLQYGGLGCGILKVDRT